MKSFKNWCEIKESSFETPIVYLDFDETLVRTTQLESFVYDWAFKKYNQTDRKKYNQTDRKILLNAVKNDFLKYQEEMTNDLKELNPFVFDHPSGKYISLLRPHVFDFISALSEYRIAILTAGKKEFQQNILSKYNLPISVIYGKFEYNQIPPCNNCILVDDLDINTIGVNLKLKAMGIENPDPEENHLASNHHVKVDPWFGDKNDTGLLNIIPEIKRKMALING